MRFQASTFPLWNSSLATTTEYIGVILTGPLEMAGAAAVTAGGATRVSFFGAGAGAAFTRPALAFAGLPGLWLLFGVAHALTQVEPRH